MGKLSHIRGQMDAPKPVAIEGMLEAIAQNVAKTVAESISDDFTRQGHGMNVIQDRVDALQPAVTASLSPVIVEAVQSIKPALRSLQADLRKRAITQKDMVKLQADLVRALSNVQIPDYSDQIESLRKPDVDLSPVLKAVKEIEFPEAEDRPLKWRFDVKRDPNGFITEVIAEAGE